MATAAQVREFREAQSNVVQLAERELEAFYATLNPENALQTTRALELFLPELIQEYGDIGATVAADFYEELRTDANLSRPFRAMLSEAIPLEQALVSTKWAVGPLFQAQTDAAATFSNLVDVTDRLIKQRGRNTIHHNARNDPAQVRYARVPSGTDTCSYCLMLASRGAVYTSKENATALNKYHGKCDCVPTPVFSDADLDRLKQDSGYDPDEYYDRWQEALEAEKAAKAAE